MAEEVVLGRDVRRRILLAEERLELVEERVLVDDPVGDALRRGQAPNRVHLFDDLGHLADHLLGQGVALAGVGRGRGADE